MTEPDPIAPEVTKLIHLFSEEPSLKFPDLDATALRGAASQVKDRHEEVVRVEAALLAARAALEEEQEALLKKALRAHAYLRVYAESDAALATKVDAIQLPKSRRAPRVEAPVGQPEGAPLPRKRGRPRKVSPAGSLFSGAEAGADGEEGGGRVGGAPPMSPEQQLGPH